MSKLKTLLLGAPALLTSALVFAEGEEAAPARDSGMWQTVIMIGLALVFFYFIMWRPERKRRKEAETRRNSLKKGDQVTAMGILGQVVRVTDNTVVLKLYDGAKMEVLKAAISDVRPATEEESKKLETECCKDTKCCE